MCCTCALCPLREGGGEHRAVAEGTLPEAGAGPTAGLLIPLCAEGPGRSCHRQCLSGAARDLVLLGPPAMAPLHRQQDQQVGAVERRE